MKLKVLLAGAVAAMSLVGAASGAQAANLITNGDFSAGCASWSTNSNAYYCSNSYSEGAVGYDASLTQVFADAVGGVLTLDYDWSGSWYQYVQFNGVTVPGSYTNNTGGHYTFNLGAGSGSDTLTFRGRNDPSYNNLDNVSVTQTAAVPEPATWALMIGGMGLAGATLRRRRAIAVAA